jgi:hypothetical protein
VRQTAPINADRIEILGPPPASQGGPLDRAGPTTAGTGSKPEPASRNTSTPSATVFTAPPHREMACAANRRR